MLIACGVAAQAGLLVGGAVTLHELIDALRSSQGTGEQHEAEPWRHMAAHIERIAGMMHVRVYSPACHVEE